MDIRWKRGEFRKFFAKMKIRVGSVGNAAGGVIQEGDEFEYDGSILKYAGAELQSTQLRGAVLNDWVTIDENDTPETLAQKIHVLEHAHFPVEIEKIVS